MLDHCVKQENLGLIIRDMDGYIDGPREKEIKTFLQKLTIKVEQKGPDEIYLKDADPSKLN